MKIPVKSLNYYSGEWETTHIEWSLTTGAERFVWFAKGSLKFLGGIILIYVAVVLYCSL